ncbi:MAG: hypothetical protein MUO68_01405 [Desulfobacteraceae bacterium]|nr:hypothetical protein [Desulfobacteraceae bacterium]
MTHIPEESKVIYRSKDDKKEKVFDALEWLGAMCCQPQHTDGRLCLSHLMMEE